MQIQAEPDANLKRMPKVTMVIRGAEDIEDGGCRIAGYCISGRIGKRQRVSWKTWPPVRPPCSIFEWWSCLPLLLCMSVAEDRVAAPSKCGPSAFILALLT